jgi:hypothetical protein
MGRRDRLLILHKDDIASVHCAGLGRGRSLAPAGVRMAVPRS